MKRVFLAAAVAIASLGAVTAVGCAQTAAVTAAAPQVFQTSLYAGYTLTETARSTAAILLTGGKISKAQAVDVQAKCDAIRGTLDALRGASGDAAATATLQAALSTIAALSQSLTALKG